MASHGLALRPVTGWLPRGERCGARAGQREVGGVEA